MRAFLIDPGARTLTTVEYDGDYTTIYQLLGIDTFDVVRFGDDGDVIYVDDEGLMKGPTDFFLIEGYPQPIAGKGLVLGTDAEGDDIEPKVSEEWLRENLDFGNMMNLGGTLMFMGDRHRRIIT